MHCLLDIFKHVAEKTKQNKKTKTKKQLQKYFVWLNV